MNTSDPAFLKLLVLGWEHRLTYNYKAEWELTISERKLIMAVYNPDSSACGGDVEVEFQAKGKIMYEVFEWSAVHGLVQVWQHHSLMDEFSIILLRE